MTLANLVDNTFATSLYNELGSEKRPKGLKECNVKVTHAHTLIPIIIAISSSTSARKNRVVKDSNLKCTPLATASHWTDAYDAPILLHWPLCKFGLQFVMLVVDINLPLLDFEQITRKSVKIPREGEMAGNTSWVKTSGGKNGDVGREGDAKAG